MIWAVCSFFALLPYCAIYLLIWRYDCIIVHNTMPMSSWDNSYQLQRFVYFRTKLYTFLKSGVLNSSHFDTIQGRSISSKLVKSGRLTRLITHYSPEKTGIWPLFVMAIFIIYRFVSINLKFQNLHPKVKIIFFMNHLDSKPTTFSFFHKNLSMWKCKWKNLSKAIWTSLKSDCINTH